MKVFTTCRECNTKFRRLFPKQRLCDQCRRIILLREPKINPSKDGLFFKSIIERDKNKCKICFSQKNLQVHHLDKNRKNNSQLNLITVCKKCHSNIHQIMRVRKNENFVLISVTKDERKFIYNNRLKNKPLRSIKIFS